MTLSVFPRRAAWSIAIIVGLLTVASIAGQVARYTVLHGRYAWYVGLFDLNSEQNLPAYYQGVSLLACAILLAIFAADSWRRAEPSRLAWVGLALLFLILSIDEMCSLHEQFEKLLHRRGMAVTDLLRDPRTMLLLVPGVPAILWYGALLWRQPRTLSLRMLGAGAIYMLGAVGVDMTCTVVTARFGDNNLACQLLANLEELMEMVGVGWLAVTLVRHLGERAPIVSLQFASAREPKLASAGATLAMAA
jgi:hypothetical protein